MIEKIKTDFKVGRLCMRHEGEFWVAYYALPDKWEDRIELSRIRFYIVKDNDITHDLYLTMMTNVVANMVESITGIRPEMIREPTPENERSGHA